MRVYNMPLAALLVSFGISSSGQANKPPNEGSGLVRIPVLVEAKSGGLAYDLSESDFSVKDNGVKQRAVFEQGTERKPLTLVLILQTGHGGAAELRTITRVNGLLDSAVTSPEDQVAIIGFDSRPQVLLRLTSDSGEMSTTLASITGGNSGAALFDSVHLALGLLQEAPTTNRKVIVLVSGEHDHGSNASDIGSLIRDVSASDVSLYSLCFRKGRSGLMDRLGSLNPMTMLSNAVEKNAAGALAQMSGGEFYRFDSKKEFEDRGIEIANHINNRYELSFHPSDPEPGFHNVQVEVDHSKMSVIAARTGYWIPGQGQSQNGGIEK